MVRVADGPAKAAALHSTSVQLDVERRPKRGRPKNAPEASDSTPRVHAKSIIPGHHAEVPAYGSPSVLNATLPLSVAAAMDHLHHGARPDQRHRVCLPDEFQLGHIEVEVFYDGRRMGTAIRDTRTGATFRTLPEFLAHLHESGYNTQLPFYVEDYIDGARKQIGFQYRKKQVVNPNLSNEFACTPNCIYRFLEQEWGKRISAFDPAPRNPTVDSLTTEWHCAKGECVYVNPPFKHMAQWGAKILEELSAGRVANVVLLMPGRTSPDWFHHVVLKYASRVVVGRNSLRFKGYNHHLPTGVIIADFYAPLRENTAGVLTTSARFHDWDR